MTAAIRTGIHTGIRTAGWVAVVAGVSLALLLPASAAWAHGAHAPTATNYRAEITGLTPAVDGLSVRLVEAGTGLELTNRTGTPVQVLGYDGEPYLELRADGVYENVHSPATYRSRAPSGATAVPPEADPAAEPRWRRSDRGGEARGGGVVARWYDERTRWTGTRPPAEVRADPGTARQVRQWRVPLRYGDAPGAVTGTLAWVPPPVAWPWWLGALLGTAGTAALGLRAYARPVRLPLALLAAGGAVAAITYAVARELDAGAGSPGEVVAWLATGALWPVAAGLATLAAGGYLLLTVIRRRSLDEGAAMALAVAGACLAIFAGFADAAVFHRSVPPVPFGAGWARLCVAAALATGAGGAAAGALTLRRTSRPPGGGRVGRVSDSRLQPGDPAPAFALPTDTGETVSLADLRGRKVILYAYPAAMTPGCTKQACDFRDSLASLQAAGYEVIGVSPDEPARLAKFRARDGLTFRLLSDPDKAVMTAYGAWGEKKMYGKTVTGVIRSTFVIDEHGRIERAWYNVKATGHVAKLRRELGLD